MRATSLTVDSLKFELLTVIMPNGNVPVGSNGMTTGGSVLGGSDGSVVARGPGDQPNGLAQIGRIRVVNAPPDSLARGDDGLFRLRQGADPLQADPSVKVVSGALEGSNVNPVEAMVDMIANARRFEMQMKMISGVDSNDQRANSLLGNN